MKGVAGVRLEIRAREEGVEGDMVATRVSILATNGFSCVMPSSIPSLRTAPENPDVAPEGPLSDASSMMSDALSIIWVWRAWST